MSLLALITLFVLIYLFLTALGLRCCVQTLVAARGTILHRYTQAPHCSGFSCCRAQALRAPASVVTACGLWRIDSVIAAHGLSCPAACGIFRDGSHLPCICRWILNHQTTREVLDLNFFSVKWMEKAPLCIAPTHCFHQAPGAPCLPLGSPSAPRVALHA